MGFFSTEDLTSKSGFTNSRISVDLLHRHGCSLCPLDRVKELRSPKMEPSGSETPLVYLLGEAPGEIEDQRGEPFVGRSGRLLRGYIPNKYQSKVRYSNTQHCFPGRLANGDFAKPSDVSLECCRSRVDSDIERTKPKIVIGLGGYALQWATGQARITQWRGRRLPIQVGSHTCWFYPIFHPSFILHQQEQRNWGDDELIFQWDMARAFAELERLPEPVVHTPEDAKRNVVILGGYEPGALRKVKEWLEYAAQAPHCGVDYETNGKRPYRNDAKILTAAVSVGDKALAFAFDHREAGWSDFERTELGALWTDFLVSQTAKAVHFLSFELEWSAVMFGREVVRASRWEDTATQAFVLDERVGKHEGGPLSLGWLTTQYFGLNIKDLSQVNRKNMEAHSLQTILPYNAVDARYHDYLFVAQRSRLKEQELLEHYELMLRRVPTTVLTQIKGIPVDSDVTAELADEYGCRLQEIDYSISQDHDVIKYNRTHDVPFNASSPAQVQELFSGIGIHLGVTKRSKFVESADEEALKQVNHPAAPLIISHRKYTKRKSTYVDAYSSEGFLWPDGSLHPNLNTIFVRTERTSADDPNIQNVPKHDEGKEVRRQIKPRPGRIFVSADQGQIQARNIAMESCDKAFCKMLWEDYDIHGEWGERFAHRYPDAIGGRKNLTDKNVMKAFRQKTKNKFVFAMFFNAQIPTIVSGMEIPEEYVKPEYEEFWRVFHGIKDWHEKLAKDYREHGYIRSLAGAIHRAPLSPNQLINTPIQADEAAIVLDGMNRLSETGDELLQANIEVHDDLVFELPDDGSLSGYVDDIVTEMLRCDFEWINVPLSVEVSTGYDWLHMNEVAKFRSDKWLGTPIRAKEYQ